MRYVQSAVVGPFACLACPLSVAVARRNPGADLRTLPEKNELPAALVPTSPLIAGAAGRQTRIRTGPAPPSALEATIPAEAAVTLSGEPVSLTIEQMPLPAFINTVFGDTLHLTFEIDPKIAPRTDPVTLRTGRRLQPNEILAVTRAVLRDYGISVLISDHLSRIVPNEALLSQSPNVSVAAHDRDRRKPQTDLPISASGQRPANMVVMAADRVQDKGSGVSGTPANAILLLGLPDDSKPPRGYPHSGPAPLCRAPQPPHRARLLVRRPARRKTGRYSSRRGLQCQHHPAKPRRARYPPIAAEQFSWFCRRPETLSQS